MSENLEQCPICKLEEQEVINKRDYGHQVTYGCSRCGKFTISKTAEGVIDRNDKSAELSGWLKERNLLGIEIPMLDSSFLEGVIKNLPNYSPLEKQHKLLKAIELLTDYPGSEVFLVHEHAISLAWAKNIKEFEYYVDSLIGRGLIEVPISWSPNDIHRPTRPLVITAAGWEYLEKDETDLASKTQAFIAMSFDTALQSVYENAIAPAIKLTGYRPYRVDSKPHLERIDAKIIAEIKNSRFIVADVTQQKAGVYYEAGFAHGLGIPVIWCVKRDDLENVHFDTRQYNHILWESENELKEKLRDFILATIGDRQSK